MGAGARPVAETSRFDSGLQASVKDKLTTQKGYTVISLRPDESTAWYSFMNPNAGSAEHQLRLSITPALFPTNTTDHKLTKALFKCDLASVTLPLSADLSMSIKPGRAAAMNLTFRISDVAGGVPANGGDPFGDWQLTIDRRTIPTELRRKAADGTIIVENIGGSSCYLLDPASAGSRHRRPDDLQLPAPAC